MKTRKRLIQEILACRGKHVEKGKRIGKRYGWRDTAKDLYPHLEPNATGALLNKLYKHPEYNPGKDVCERLHIVFYESHPVCPIHGVVHVSRRCPQPRKPRLPWMSADEIEERLEFIRSLI